MRSKEKHYYIHELIKFKYKIANEDIDFSFEDISEVSKIHTSIGETVSYIVDLEKEIERIKSLDIYKLVEDADTGQLLHKDKIRAKIKELEKDKQTILQEIEGTKESKDEEFLKYNREILYRINGEIQVLKELEGE